MKLLTKEIIKKLPPIYSTDGQIQREVMAKFFCPWNAWTWYAFEGEAIDENGDNPKDSGLPVFTYKFFGIVEGHEKELGYFLLSELESVKGPGGLRIERDRNFIGEYDIKLKNII